MRTIWGFTTTPFLWATSQIQHTKEEELPNNLPDGSIWAQENDFSAQEELFLTSLIVQQKIMGTPFPSLRLI